MYKRNQLAHNIGYATLRVNALPRALRSWLLWAPLLSPTPRLALRHLRLRSTTDWSQVQILNGERAHIFLMRRIFRDALNTVLQKLGFPWLTPHPTKSTKEIGYFQKSISQNDLYEMYKRNQLAHNIVFAVALDAFSAAFIVKTPDGETSEELNEKVQALYASVIHLPLLKCYIYARLYGSAGLLIGYRDARKFEEPADPRDRIEYLFAIPPKWVSQKVAVKDNAGNVTIPPELEYYELSTPYLKIHASRLVHLQPLSIEEDLDGESVLYPIFDVLTVLKNTDWSIGQTMFRHGAGFTTVVAGDGASQEQIDAIDDSVTEINAKTVITFPPGCKIDTHRPGALDPEPYYSVISSQIAGGANIPVSILLGAQKGALEAATKDRKDYADMLASIRAAVITPALTEILKKFQASGQLPRQEFVIEWAAPDIFLIDTARGNLYNARAKTEEAKAELLRAQTKQVERGLPVIRAIGGDREEL